MGRSAEMPVIAVLCDNPAHGEPFVVARFCKPPKPPGGTPWIGFDKITTGSDWLLLPVFYDASVNPERQHLNRAEDLGRDGRYNLECRKCAPHSGRRITVPLNQGLVNKVCDGLNGVGCISVTLSLLAASV